MVDPYEIIEANGYEINEDDEETKDDFYQYFLETQYGTPISDYGLKPLWNIALKLAESNNDEEKLMLIDQMLNVVHQRGDLAALFIEGGSGALTQLSEIN
jgi:hypothetical protein